MLLLLIKVNVTMSLKILATVKVWGIATFSVTSPVDSFTLVSVCSVRHSSPA